MQSANLKEIFEVWNRVKTWDPEMRIDLARRILETVGTLANSTTPTNDVIG